MKLLLPSVLYLSLLFSSLPGIAGTKLAGIDVADHYFVDGQALKLNGAGVRSKFFVKVYVGALYLETITRNAAQATAMTGAKSMQMHMLYKEVSAAKITSGWTDGFRANLNLTELAGVQERLDRFNRLFPDLQSGDLVRMDHTPGKGTTVSRNGKTLGTIAGDDFFAALLKVWIGEQPADKKLKAGLLGG